MEILKSRYLLTLALAPAVLLFFYIRKKDKIEEEPMKLLLGLSGLGAVSTIFAGVYESILISPFDSILDSKGLLYNIITNFLIIAVAEEGVKFLILYLMTWWSKEYNYTFDAVVYAVSVSLGFAALENILYVFNGGFATAILRAFTSIPGHTIFAVYMGYYYGVAKKFSSMKDHLKAVLCLALALISPIMIHGFYDFCLGMGNPIMIIVFFAFDITITILAFFKVNRLSKYDTPISQYQNNNITNTQNINNNTNIYQ